jgi:extracellular elastinolytic metalloproteinase
MRKILLSLVFLSLVFFVNAQNNDNVLAKQLVSKNAAAIGLSQDALNNYIVSSAYFDKSANTELVYLLQSYKGLPVWNQMLVMSFRDGKLLSKAGSFLDNIAQLTSFKSATPATTPADAVRSSITDSKVAMPASLAVRNTLDPGKKYDFGKLQNITTENVTAELMWVPVLENGKITSVKLAWEVQLYLAHQPDYWNIRVDASTNKVIDKNNLTVYENFDKFKPSQLSNADQMDFFKTIEELQKSTSPENKINADFFNSPNILNSPTLVGTANYTIIPYPVESPLYGPAAVRTNPWTLAGGNATTLQWQNDGTLDYIISRGNNVHAHEDQANNNSNNGIVATSTTSPDPLNFTYAGQPNYTVQPTTPLFQQFAITNLFYWNNIVHDMSYKYGFDEPAGNFQANNLGRGGLQNDYVQADAQDGGGTNNANFATPVDGVNPRMQMYLFSPAPATITFVVNSPAVIAGQYTAVEGAMSTNNLLINVGPKTGQLIYYNDDAPGTTHYACNPPANTLTGKVALINRGFGGAICTAAVNFTTKVLNAQNAGAIAVVMVNNVSGAPIVMGGTDNTITIPAVMISDVDGATIAAQLANNVNVTLSATGGGTVNLDGDIDNGVITHEYFHGVSTRLTGGPANSSCLNNAEEGGEGWSDYNALMLTTDWSTAVITDGFNKKRPIGNYVEGQPTTGPGIRNYPYCTNIAINPLTYANMGVAPIGTEVHNIGEIWCETLWEMTWQIIQTDGINPNLWNNGTAGGNSVAYRLVIAGLKLQPCSPGYIDARNAILQADQNLYAGIHTCSIWTAFAKRGMGFSASEGSSNSATDQTPAFDLPPGAVFTAQPTNSTTCNGSTVSFSATATGATTYQWQVSTTGCGGTFTNVTNVAPYSGATTNTLTINPAAVSMNGYAYRLVASTTCGSGNSNCAVLTVVAAAVGGTVTPANTSVCATPNSTLLTLTGNVGPVTQWQSSTVSAAGPFTAIAGTAGLQTYTATNVAVTTWYNVLISAVGCASATSSVAAITVLPGALPMYIVADPGTTVCAGDPARLTVMEGGSATTVIASESSDNTTITVGNSILLPALPRQTVSGVHTISPHSLQ